MENMNFEKITERTKNHGTQARKKYVDLLQKVYLNKNNMIDFILEVMGYNPEHHIKGIYKPDLDVTSKVQKKRINGGCGVRLVNNGYGYTMDIDKHEMINVYSTISGPDRQQYDKIIERIKICNIMAVKFMRESDIYFYACESDGKIKDDEKELIQKLIDHFRPTEAETNNFSAQWF